MQGVFRPDEMKIDLFSFYLKNHCLQYNELNQRIQKGGEIAMEDDY
jgi:hypothetical protein